MVQLSVDAWLLLLLVRGELRKGHAGRGGRHRAMGGGHCPEKRSERRVWDQAEGGWGPGMPLRVDFCPKPPERVAWSFPLLPCKRPNCGVSIAWCCGSKLQDLTFSRQKSSEAKGENVAERMDFVSH